METKLEIIDFKQVNTKDQQLSADNADKLYLEFIDLLLENCIFNLADSMLQYVTNHNTERYLLALAKIRGHQERYLEAVEPLDKLLSQQPTHQQAWVMRGHAYYLNGNLFDSEESYITALRIKPAPKDAVLQERLGLVYIKRKSWKDAKTVFMKCCKSQDFLPSTTAWLYLGIACFRLGEMQQAEDALSQANILDHLNYRVWGMMAVLALTDFRNA